MIKQEWNFESYFGVNIELGQIDGQPVAIDNDHDEDLPDWLVELFPAGSQPGALAELALLVECTGYYLPARINAPVERCHDREGSDDRHVVGGYFEGEDNIRREFSAEQAAELAELFSFEIDRVALEDLSDAA